MKNKFTLPPTMERILRFSILKYALTFLLLSSIYNLQATNIDIDGSCFNAPATAIEGQPINSRPSYSGTGSIAGNPNEIFFIFWETSLTTPAWVVSINSMTGAIQFFNETDSAIPPNASSGSANGWMVATGSANSQCIANGIPNITVVCDIEVTDVMSKDEVCPGAADGTITVTASCGSCIGDMEYTIDGFSSTNIDGMFTGVAPGTYTVEVRDAMDATCLAEETGVVVAAGEDTEAPILGGSLADLTGECEVAMPTAPTATDNCTGTIIGTPTPSFPITTQGTTVVTWEYKDGNGNTSTQMQNVIIDDVTDPVPFITTLSPVNAECEVTEAMLIPPTATDNCPSATVTITNNVTSFPISGENTTTTVIWVYDDGNGNTSTQSQDVIIKDVTAPTPAIPTLADVTAECQVNLGDLTTPSATDNCANTTVTVTNTDAASFPISAQGTTEITWEYNDGNGNTSTQTQNVVIADMTGPAPDATSLNDITAECEVTTLTAPTAMDNCGGTVTVSNNRTLPITASTIITWIYTDENNNTSNQAQEVIIDDMTAPVPDVSPLAPLADITIECDVTPPVPTATDVCDGPVDGISDVTFPVADEGTQMVTWTYTDAAGNSSTQMQNITIDDMTAPEPVETTLDPVTDQCEVTMLTAPEATDNCGTVTVSNDVQSFPITANTTVIWTYSDGNGNSIDQTQEVVIDDMTAPVPTVAMLPAINEQCSANPTPPTATDNCDGIVTGVSSETLPITSQGDVTITWTYTDVDGNSSVQTQEVTIEDTTAPAPDMAMLATVNEQCSANPTPPTATDNCGGPVTVTSDPTLPIIEQGDFTITWTYEDENGITSEQTQEVSIDDTTAPLPDVAMLPAVNEQCEATLTAPTATDVCVGIVTATSTVPFPITAQGTTQVVWVYSDMNGNVSTQTQDVIIDDTTFPILIDAPLADVTADCVVTESMVTPPTASDNCADDPIIGTTAQTFPITAQGTTVITWTFDDGNGNITTEVQGVVISDTEAPAPVTPMLADLTGECEVMMPNAPTATDNCAGTVTATSNVTFPITTQGPTEVVWVYNDGNGNISTQTQNVIIDDITAPAPVGPLADVTEQCQANPTPPTATDNCGGTVSVTSDLTLPILSQGNHVITWTYNDGNGNTSEQTQNVTIDDTMAPVPDDPTLADVTAECIVTSLFEPVVTDNCGASVTITNDVMSFPISTQGTTVVTWTYTDEEGNSSTQTQDVVINDDEAPIPVTPTLADVIAQCEVTMLTAPTATDNCGSVTVTNNAQLPIVGEGTTVVVWLYNDGNGNISSQTQNVIIDDVTAPDPDDATLADLTDECSVTPTAPTATDNCVGALTATSNETFPITAQGTTTITWTYDDGNGNAETQDQDVIIDDTTAPAPDDATLADLSDECEVTPTAPTATDNCVGEVTATTNETFPITMQGTTVVMWTYTDAEGNSSSQTQNVIIDDVTAPIPVVPMLADVTGECEATPTAPTASDNCAGLLTATTTTTLPITAQGTTTITWTYNDGNGNSITQDQDVIIEDVTAPDPDEAMLTEITAQCEVTTLTAPTATDNCGMAMVTGTTTTQTPITTNTTVTWTYTDAEGNSSTQTQDVIIDDMTAPVPGLAMLPDLTGECEVIMPTAPVATDNCAGFVTGTTMQSFPISTQGTTDVTWTYEDNNGNTSTQIQQVIINDMTDPVPAVVTLTDVTAECEVASLTAPTATDNCGGTVTVTNDAMLPITAQGTTVVTWKYDDGNNNTSTQTQKVIINDVTAPTPFAMMLADVTAECEVTTLTEPTATDNCGGTVMVTNDVTLPITAQGTTVVTWIYNDGNNNISTQTQNVIIDDVTGPMPDVASLSNVTAECEVTMLTAPTATDLCGGSVTVTNNATLPITGEGTTPVTWTYTDVNGNTTTQIQNVVIDDVTAPTPDAMMLADVTAVCEVTNLTAPTATDNCPNAMVTLSNNVTLPITTQGTTMVTWTFSDGNGNTSTQIQNVIISDTEAPVVTAPADITVEVNNGCISDNFVLGSATVTDNCNMNIIPTNNALTSYSPGVHTITWLANDGNQLDVDQQTLTVIASDINLQGNGTDIASGDNTPDGVDNTDFGSILVGASVTSAFTIQNMGDATLDLTGNPIVTISGSTNFSVTTQPSATTIISGDPGLTFEVTYSSSTVGTDDATISIASNDCDTPTYTFDITGQADVACDIAITSITTTDEICPGADDGTLTVVATCTSCTGGIEYSIDGFITFNTNGEFTNLADGTYTVEVRDAGNMACTATDNSGTVINPGAVVLNVPTTPNGTALFKASQTVNSDATVQLGQGTTNITFEAGNDINLLQDFEVELGAHFEANIVACPE